MPVDQSPDLRPLRQLQGQRIVDVLPDPDGGFPVLISEAGDALILIDWRQGKTSFQPTDKARELYSRQRRQPHGRRRKSHV